MTDVVLGLSLYRGLLKQSNRLTDAETASAVASHVKRRFKLDKRAQSLAVICNGLEIGRKYFDIIRDVADGSVSATAKLEATLSEVERHTQNLKTLRAHQAKLRDPTHPSKLKKIAHLQRSRTKEWAQRIPNPIPIFDRPVPKEQLPNPDQPRRVPHLTSGQGIPFLRYKSGPQSVELSRSMRSIHLQENKRWGNIERLKHEIDHALLEDNWDRLVGRITGGQDDEDVHEEDHVSWADSTRFTDSLIRTHVNKSTNKRRENAQRMFEIMKQEKVLATEEREERKRRQSDPYNTKL